MRDVVFTYIQILLSLSTWFGVIYNKLTTWWVAIVKMVPNFVLAILILILFYFLARLLRNLIFKLLHRISGKAAVSGFVATLTNLLILLLGVFIALNILKLESAVASLLAGASIIGLAVGFAFQDLTANFISGAYIAFRKPFEVGDLIQTNDFLGNVEEINLRSSTIRTFEGLHVLLPNKEIFQKPIINYSRTNERKIELTFIIPQKANLQEIKDKILVKMSSLNYLHSTKPTEFYYTATDGNNLKGVLSVWIQNHEPPGYLEARHQVLMLATDALKETGNVI
jgi:small conductance mechanosensitive channel